MRPISTSRHLTKTEGSKTVSELCKIVGAEFEKLLSNGGATLRHKRTMDSCLKKFEARFGASSVKTLTGTEIKEWLAAIPDTKVKTQNNLLGYIRDIYGIALEKTRSHSNRSGRSWSLYRKSTGAYPKRYLGLP